ncbi:unnamed protein product [Angiostrongylus costaricensis]|uniref:Transmembrane protein n=1 Tax=Angiostrongylus costaricensis TaxID=334426 RepID=A0A0R3PP38_ANGCS|nr:unnamed protein product [Angiostrongylus costaricensis]
MYVNASTSSASSPEEFKVKVPKSRKENRLLKSGFVDDNNDHLCYLELSIVWPAAVCAVLSMLLFIAAIAASLYNDYIPTEKELLRTFFAAYGSTSFACNTTLPLPVNGIPSALKLLEINASGNVLFRLCTCIPVVIRLFISNIQCATMRAEYELLPFFYRISIEVVPLLTFIEVFSLALFSIITSHSDFPGEF